MTLATARARVCPWKPS